MTFTEQMQKIITDCGLSRYEIAKRSGVQESSLSRFMSGTTGVSTRTLDRLAALLSITVHCKRNTHEI